MHHFLRRLTLVCIIVCLGLFTQAQPLEYNERVADSILRVLPTAKEDTNKVMGMLTLAAMSLSRFDSAKVMYWADEARTVSEKIDYTMGVLLAIGQRAFFHSITSNWPVALQEINEGMKLSKDKDSSFVTFFYSLRVIISNTRENYQDAKHWAMLCLNTPGFENAPIMSRWPTYMQLGIIYDNLNMTDSAAYYAEKCKEMMKVMRFRDLEQNSWLTIGNVARKRKNYAEALFAFRHYPELSLGMARTYSDMGVKDSALYYGKMALEIAQKQNVPQGIMAASAFLSAEYEKTNPAQSLQYLKLYSATREQSFNAEKLKTVEAQQLSEQQANFEAAQKETKARNKMIQFSLLGLAALLTISALFLYRVSAVRKTNNEKLSKAYDELKQTQQKLIHAEKMASLGQLTAGIAHEIQNPLNFVNNFAELNGELAAELREQTTDPAMLSGLQEMQGNAEKIMLHGKRAEAIVRSMLQHSNTRSGTVSDVPLNTLVQDTWQKVQHNYRNEINQHQLNLASAYDPNITVVKAVPQEIAVALSNILNNAFQAVIEKAENETSTYRGAVNLQTKLNDNAVEIIVQDNGPGIDPAHLQKIFQPFFTTKPTGQGTGLGLSLTYDMIKAHGGEIQVESKEGEGARFSIVLPVG